MTMEREKSLRATATTTLIDKRVVEKNRGTHRRHLGASQIGAPCARALWYQFRWAKSPSFPGRVLRLFERGHKEEDNLIYWLEMAGVKVRSIDTDTGKQWQIEAFGGHFGGSLDGIAVGLQEDPDTWHVLEFKTHNDKSFKALVKGGVRNSKPQHYAQMQIYMHHIGYHKSYYLAVNKNDDDLYAEIVDYNKDFATTLMSKAENIIFSDEPPERIGGPAWYECKWCEYREICHGEEMPERNCRTCIHATAKENGTWDCAAGRQFDEKGWGLPCHRFNPHAHNLTVEGVSEEDVRYTNGWTDSGPYGEPQKKKEKIKW